MASKAPHYWTISSNRTGACVKCKTPSVLDELLVVQCPDGNYVLMHPQCIAEGWLESADYQGDLDERTLPNASSYTRRHLGL